MQQALEYCSYWYCSLVLAWQATREHMSPATLFVTARTGDPPVDLNQVFPLEGAMDRRGIALLFPESAAVGS